MTIITFTQKNDALEELEELQKADEIRHLSDDEYTRFAELQEALDKFNEIISNFET